MDIVNFFTIFNFYGNTINFYLNIILTSIIFYTLIILILDNTLNKNLTTISKLIFIIANCTVYTISLIFIKSSLSQLIIILFVTISLIIVLKESYVKYILYSIIFSIIYLNSQLFMLKHLSLLLNDIKYSKLINMPIFYITLLISLLISFIFTYIIVRHSNIQKIKTFSENSSREKYLIYAIDYILIIQFGKLIYTFYSSITFTIFIILYCFLNFYFWISIKNIVRIFEIEEDEKKINTLELYNKSISEAYDSTRTFKHDFNNIIQAMGGYIYTKDLPGLEEYFNQLFSEIKTINSLSNLNPNLINNPAIYSVLAEKHFSAEKYNINFNLDISLDLNTLNSKIYEITKILGILLDNAIETCKECNKKTINIIFKQTKYKQIIKVENTYTDKEICIEKLFEKGYSTKKNNTGLGLWEVKKILNKNNNLNLFTTKDNMYFMQQLEIY